MRRNSEEKSHVTCCCPRSLHELFSPGFLVVWLFDVVVFLVPVLMISPFMFLFLFWVLSPLGSLSPLGPDLNPAHNESSKSLVLHRLDLRSWYHSVFSQAMQVRAQ